MPGRRRLAGVGERRSQGSPPPTEQRRDPRRQRVRRQPAGSGRARHPGTGPDRHRPQRTRCVLRHGGNRRHHSPTAARPTPTMARACRRHHQHGRVDVHQPAAMPADRGGETPGRNRRRPRRPALGQGHDHRRRTEHRERVRREHHDAQRAGREHHPVDPRTQRRINRGRALQHPGRVVRARRRRKHHETSTSGSGAPPAATECQAIPGATAATYTPTAADAGTHSSWPSRE